MVWPHFFFMNIIVIIVYNRFKNLSHWLQCWQQCNQSAKLVVIHNADNPENDEQIYPHKKACEVAGVQYIVRQNIGMDIGAFQDVCLNRLHEFPEFEKLLWITDDTWPMDKDFAGKFFDSLIGNTGCVCMEISPYVRRHIRTTGFAITKNVANKLTFPADPVTTKEHCYIFEHRSNNTLYDQVIKMGLKVIMVAPQATSPLFDTGYTRRLKAREREHYHTFGMSLEQPAPEPNQGLVIFLCPIYQNFPMIAYCLLQQTYKNWQLWVIHDGPGKIDLPDDPRINFVETESRVGNYGHSIRAEWLQKLAPQCDYIVISNPDNYYVPVFIEYALRAFRAETVATFCSHIIHNYIAYKIMTCRLERGFIDCGQVMVRSKEAAVVGWNSMHPSSDWFYFQDIFTRYGKDKFVPYEGCTMIHN